MATSISTAVQRSKQKPFGEKMAGFLKEFPDEGDVTFSVGPQKTKIKSSRLALMASSPAIYSMFKNKWDTAVTNQGDGIPLPDFEPNSFEAFLKILLSDDWSPAGLKEMNLSTDTVFKLIEISKKFNVLDLQGSLQVSNAEFFENFGTFVKSAAFLELSRETLEIVLSSNFITLDEVTVFDAALKWAMLQCTKRGQTQNGENWRHVLGPALFQIRFPLMTFTDFSNIVGTTGILSETEEFKILKFISLSDQNRLSFNACNFPFKTEIRQSAAIFLPGIEILKLFEDSEIVDSPHFACDGAVREAWLQVDKQIAVESVGFLGPLDRDSLYEVSVEIKKRNSNDTWTSIQKVNKTLKVKCKEKFEVAFNPPVVLDATYIHDSFCCRDSPYYGIFYSLKGSNTQSGSGADTNFRREVCDIGFYCYFYTSGPKSLQFLKFKQV